MRKQKRTKTDEKVYCVLTSNESKAKKAKNVDGHKDVTEHFFLILDYACLMLAGTYWYSYESATIATIWLEKQNLVKKKR